MNRLDKLNLLQHRKKLAPLIEKDFDKFVGSLKGLDGKDGLDGEDGRDGLPGIAGKDGRHGLPGPRGPIGKDGRPGIKGDPGLPGIVWLGEWEALRQYRPGDAVAAFGSAFICTKAHKALSANKPTTGEGWRIYWGILAERGEQGPGGSPGANGSSSSGGGGTGTVTSVGSADSSITITNPTTTPDLAVAKAPILSTARNIDGQAFDGSGNITVIAPGTHAASSKATPVDADELPLVDSAASNVLKKLTWANLKATIKAYYDPVTSSLTNKDLTSGTNTFPTFNQNTSGSAAKWTTARNLAGNSVDGSANVAFANNFIVQGTADAGLSAAQFLGSLGTGIVKNTTTTGVLSIAVAGDFPTLNQNTSGTASNLSGTPALPNGTTATTQTANDNSTKLSTTAYVDAATLANKRFQVLNTGLGIVSQNVPLHVLTAASTVSTTRVYAQLAPFLVGDIVTNIVFQTRAAGAGTTPTTLMGGICDKNGVVKQVTANFAASTDLTTANKISAQALAAQYTIPTTDVYYLWLWASGTWGTTQMTLADTSNTSGIVGGPIGSGFASTATTTTGSTPTTSTTFTLVSPANTSVYWMAAS